MYQTHAELMATDPEYAADYAAQTAFENWQEEQFFKKQAAEEIFEDFFDDYRISFDGCEEIDEPKVIEIDPDIPF